MTEEESAKMVKEISDLQKSVADLASRVGTPEQQANRRLRYQENGNWARHYSTVRMTTTTFLVGVSLGILSFKWTPPAQPQISFVALSGIVWMLAVLLLLVFTRLTYGEMEKARARRCNLPDGGNAGTNLSHHPRQDAASWIVAILTIFFGALLFYLGHIWLGHFRVPGSSSFVRALACAVPGCVVSVGLGAALFTRLQPPLRQA